MPYIDIATGARMEYVDQGAGVPLIAIHGLLGTARTHLGDLIDWLSDSYRVVGPSLRGYGQSRPKPRDFPPDFYRRDARDVLALMDALEIERAHVIGFSDGGETALMAAGLAPERFLSCAAWGAVGYYGPAMRDVVTNPNYPQRITPGPTEMTRHGILDGEAFARAWIAAVLHMIEVDGGDVSLSLADRITCPLLMMLGRADHLNPAEYAQRFLDRARHGRLELFDGGHPCHTEHPDAFRRVLGEFLAGA